jgi:amino acid transporter
MPLNIFQKLRYFFIGAPRDPFKKSTRKNIALIAFLAWIGLGADGLSSSSYGPEEGFLALGSHYHLALYLAVATALTVFLISLAYNQVIELFPSGGGGYKVASRLIGKHAGLVSGSALIVDYVLTIAISIASGIDALFSLFPVGLQPYKLYFEVAAILLLIVLNLRGMKESIKILMPIFLGFVLTHFALIFYGIFAHGSYLPTLFQTTVQETYRSADQLGWLVVLGLFLRAYSLGGGTYTGLEAVSNNVNHLAEPRVRTGKWTMFYMALSLSMTAGGIILLYLLWNVTPVQGETLNAVVFKSILGNMPFHHGVLILTLFLEAGLLFLAANTGFLGGPAVLANMAIDGWIPKGFRNLSSRLVTQNGIVLYGIAAIGILFWTGGKVSMLVVLYSMNVFLTFSLSLLGLSIYWWQCKNRSVGWLYHMLLSVVGCIVCVSILCVTLFEKFTSGGWLTVLITGSVILFCWIVKRHYAAIYLQIKHLDKLLTLPLTGVVKKVPPLEPDQPTAAFLIGESVGEGMHTLLWVQRMFPGQFKNFVFISGGVVDVGSYGSAVSLKKMQATLKKRLQYFIDFSHEHGLAATAKMGYGSDPIAELEKLAEEVQAEFSNTVFFSASLISKQDNWFYRKLHSDIPLILQHHLHLKGLQMVIVPVKLER